MKYGIYNKKIYGRKRSNMADSKNFFSFLIELILGSHNDPHKEKIRMLKSLEATLRKRGKYFKVNSLQVQPGLARFFHDIYTVVGGASIGLQNISKSQTIRTIIIESFFSKEALKTVSLIRGDEIEKVYAQLRNTQVLRDRINESVDEVNELLSNSQIASQINTIYSYILAFSEFCTYDYYFLLHKFDYNYPENNYKYRPSFHSATITSVIEALDEFLHVAMGILGNVNWNKIFAVLLQYRNVELINRSAWDKVLTNTRQMISEETLQLILRLAKEDPHYEVSFKPTSTDIIKPYLAALKDEASKQIGRVVSLERSRLMSKVLQEIFGTTKVTVFLKNYTQERNNVLFVGRGVLEYLYHEVLNTAVVFSYEYLQKDIKILVDLLILKGKWSQNVHYKEFSAAFQSLLNSADEILNFDATLGDDSTRITRLRNALRSVDKDKFAKNTVNGILEEINSGAREVMIKIAGYYMTLGRYLKIYIEDYKLQLKSEIIINWREIEKSSDRPNLGKFMVELYTKVYYLVQMFQQFGFK